MFTKIYLGTLISVLVIALIVYVIYEPVNKQRLHEYQHTSMSGTLNLINYNLQDRVQDEKYIYLDLVAQLMGAELKVITEMSKLSDIQDNIPTKNKPIFNQTQKGYMQWWLYLDDKAFALMTINYLNEHQYKGQAGILVAELAKQRWPKTLNSIQQFINYPVTLIKIQQLEIESQQKSRLERGSIIIHRYNNDHSKFNVFAATTRGQVLKIGPIENFDPLPWSLVLIILICSLIAIFLVVTTMVYLLQRRFQNLIDGVDHVAAGDLNYKIGLSGKDMIARLARRIDSMTEQIRSLLTSQKELLQAVSHELRTPLAKMRFRIQLLEEEYPNSIMTKQTNAIRNDISQLEKLVEEILTHYKLGDSSSKTFEFLNIEEILRSELENYQQLNPKINFSISQADICDIKGENSSIQKLFSNLLSNASKHAIHRVTVSIVKKDNILEIRIEDDGIGIPVSQQEKVFEAFYRIDSSRNKNTGGFGLGLAIAKRVCELHSATIHVEQSQSLNGACFVIRFWHVKPK